MIKSAILCLLLIATINSFAFKRLNLRDNCNNFDGENACQGSQTDNDPSWANRAFQTPPRGD